MEDAGWAPAAVAGVVESRKSGHGGPGGLSAIMEFAADRGRARGWPAPPTSSTHVLHALDGGFVPAGPSGSPLRGLVNVLPTGRNFYSVDPKAVPSPAGVGDRPGDGRLADRSATAPTPASTRGRSACRSGGRRRCESGDDIAEVLALIGVLPVWDEASRRVTTSTDPAGRTRPAADRCHRADQPIESISVYGPRTSPLALPESTRSA